MENIEFNEEMQEKFRNQEEEEQKIARERREKKKISIEVDEEFDHPALELAVNKLSEAIDKFNEDLFKEDDFHFYVKAFKNNFRSYLIELQKYDVKAAREVVLYGIVDAKLRLKSIGSDKAHDTDTDKKAVKLFRLNTNLNTPKIVKDNEIFRIAIRAKDPKELYLSATSTAELKDWYKNIVLGKHKLAESFLDSLQNEKKGLGEKQGKKKTIPTNEKGREMKRKGEENQPIRKKVIKVANKIINSTDKDYITPSGNCQKWLWDDPRIRVINKGNARRWLNDAIKDGTLKKEKKLTTA